MRTGWSSAGRDRRIASFRFRVEAPIEALRGRGHPVEVFDPASAHLYDVVVFCKRYSPDDLALARAVRDRGGRVILDLCDNHFHNPLDLPKYRQAREEIRAMAELAHAVVCSTAALATVVETETGGAVQPLVIGDTIEPLNLAAPSRPVPSEPLRLTWFGSHGSPNAVSGVGDLALIRDELETLAAETPTVLTVCSNSREKYDACVAGFGLPTRYVEWSLERFPAVLAATDAALLPISVNPFTACKTHNRLTTALYAGVPVLASTIDSYREFAPFCRLDDWSAGLQALVDQPARERERARAARPYIERRWTMQTLAPRWEAALGLPTPKAARDAWRDVKLHGRLDAVARSAVTGWVAAPGRPDLPLQVALDCDGDIVALAFADQPREDLRRAGLDQACGFSLPIPPARRRARRMTVRVLEAEWVVGMDPILRDEEGPWRTWRPAAGDTRWDVSEVIAAQERLLADFTQMRRERDVAARRVSRAFLQASDARPDRVETARPSLLRDLLRAGWDDQDTAP
ncbi:MAG: hypothetical protein B7Y99_08130 [Caulobacterales bacterium 32-69-10]|nr:MAG: hypothetical protein B7Y99_08130 [Caulobacterales bacterium 32-69-10]